MKHQQDYINIPVWFFLLAPIGGMLLIVEFVMLCLWLYEHVEVILK